jgi:outer membrane protein assembly factor BamB
MHGANAARAMTRIVALILLPAAAMAQDEGRARWPQFRGPNAQGVAHEGNYPVNFGPQTNVLWKVPIPPGVSSPSVWGDRIFLTAYTSETHTLETLCFSRSTGAILWRRATAAQRIEKVHAVSSPANATPATDGTHVVAYFASAGLTCYNMDGNELWQKSLPLTESPFGSGTSPIIVGNLVLLNRDNSANPFARDESQSHVLAVDVRSGETVWNAPRPGSFVRYSTPVACSHEGVQQVLLVGSSRLTAYELSSGKELWWADGLPPQACATPAVDDERVYASGTGMFGEPEAFLGIPEFEEFLKDHDKDGDGLVGMDEIPKDLMIVDRRATGGAGNSPLTQFIQGTDKNGDKKFSKEEWDGMRSRVTSFMASSKPGICAIRLGGAGKLHETQTQWQSNRGVAEVPSPLIYQGRLYLLRNGGIVHCRDARDGRELFSGRLAATGGYYASPVAGDDKIYFASDQGVITVLKASDELNMLGQTNLGDRIMATPALVDSTIYVRTDHHLYAFRSQ